MAQDPIEPTDKKPLADRRAKSFRQAIRRRVKLVCDYE